MNGFRKLLMGPALDLRKDAGAPWKGMRTGKALKPLRDVSNAPGYSAFEFNPPPVPSLKPVATPPVRRQPSVVSEDMQNMVDATRSSIPPAPAPPVPPVTPPPVPPAAAAATPPSSSTFRSLAKNPWVKGTAIAGGGIGATFAGAAALSPDGSASPATTATSPSKSNILTRSLNQALDAGIGGINDAVGGVRSLNRGLDAATPETGPAAWLQRGADAAKPAIEGVTSHLKDYWPGYAAGGLGALALANALTRRKKRKGFDMEKESQDFAQRHPLVAGFLVKCAHDGCTHAQILGRVGMAVHLDDDIGLRFQHAAADPFLKNAGLGDSFMGMSAPNMKELGTAYGSPGWSPEKYLQPEGSSTMGAIGKTLGNAGNNAWNGFSGSLHTLAGGIGTGLTGLGELGGHASDAVGMTEAAGPMMGAARKVYSDHMFNGGAQVAAGLTNQTPEAMAQGAGLQTPSQSIESHAQNLQQNDPMLGMHGDTQAMITRGAKGVSDAATVGAMALQARNPLPSVSKLPSVAAATGAVAPAANAISKIPYLGPAVVAGGGLAKNLGREVIEGDTMMGGMNALSGQPISQNTATGYLTGQDQELQTVAGEQASEGGNPLPGKSLPGSEGATTNPAMAADDPTGQTRGAPRQDAGHYGGQLQQPAAPGQDAGHYGAELPHQSPDAQFSQLASDPQIPVEQKQQAATEATQKLFANGNDQVAKEIMTNGPNPEQNQLGQETFAKQVAETNPDAAQDPSFFDQISQSWNGMDNGSKALMILGGGLGLLSLVHAISGEGGIGDWLMAALGIGGAAAMGAGSGMMGPEAQQMLGGVGEQISNMLPQGIFGNNQGAPPGAPTPPPAGQNPNIPNENPQPGQDAGHYGGQLQQPAGGQGESDLSAVTQKNPWLNQFAGGGTNPKAFDAGDVASVVKSWATGGVPEQQMQQLLTTLSPAQKQQMAAGLQTKLQNLSIFERPYAGKLQALLQRVQL